MKQATKLIGVLLAALLVWPGCAEDGAPGAQGAPGATGATGADGVSVVVSIRPSAATLSVGETEDLTATTSGDVSETYTWASTDEAVATVDDNGTVTGVADGTAVIVATGDTSGANGAAAVSVLPGLTGPVSFEDDVLPLFTEDNVWYVGGSACNATGCHDGPEGAHEFDMGDYDSILAGADGGTEPIIECDGSGCDWSESGLRGRLRNNRMPWGISPMVPRDGPMVSEVADLLGWDDASSLADENGIVKLVEAWIDEGVPDGDFDYTDSAGATVTKSFDDDVLPLFTTANVWAPGTQACNAAGCHSGIGGAHDLDMGSYDGILTGADGGAEPIVECDDSDPPNCDAEESGLRRRLRNNRMPWDMPTWVPRNGPNGEVGIVGTWVDDGAQDN